MHIFNPARSDLISADRYEVHQLDEYGTAVRVFRRIEYCDGSSLQKGGPVFSGPDAQKLAHKLADFLNAEFMQLETDPVPDEELLQAEGDFGGYATDNLEYVLYLLLTKQASTYYESVVGPKEYVTVRYVHDIRHLVANAKAQEALLSKSFPDRPQNEIVNYC